MLSVPWGRSAWRHGLSPCRLTLQSYLLHSAIYPPIHRYHKQSAMTMATSNKDTDPRPNEYELRVGRAVAALQDELPGFFAKGLTDHDIYSSHIVLSDPHYTHLSVRGRTAYIGIAQMLRWSLACYFDDIMFDIVRMRVLPDESGAGLSDTADKKPAVRYLEVRWKLEGRRKPTMLGSHPVRHVEGIFRYTFDNEGLIGEHRIEHIQPPPSRGVLWLHSLGGRLRAYWEAVKQRREPALTPGLG